MMAKEQNKQNKPSYEELEQYCAQLQAQLQNQNRVSEFREMVAVCLELLNHKDVLPEATFKKVVDFIDKVVPVPKEQEGAAQEE
jgi:cell shape-determining protein MreC